MLVVPAKAGTHNPWLFRSIVMPALVAGIHVLYRVSTS